MTREDKYAAKLVGAVMICVACFFIAVLFVFVYKAAIDTGEPAAHRPSEWRK